MGLLSLLKGWLQGLRFLHKDKFTVFKLHDHLLRHLDLVLQSREFLVLTGFELLVLVAGDLVLLGLDLDLKLLALDLDLPLTCAGGLKPVICGLEFAVACGLLGWQGCDLCEDGA